MTNLGTIFGTSSYSSIGVNLLAGGTIDNKGGLIEGAIGVYGTAGAVTVMNAATIAGTAIYGVELLAGGSVANNNGRIEGPSGIYVKGGTASVSNSGTILGTSKFGVDLVAGGAVSNNGGLIAGLTAVRIGGTTGGVINSGTLSGTGGAGAYLAAGGSIDNAAGLIIGSFGVYAESAPVTVTNAATIAGTANFGIELAAGGTVSNNGGLIAGPVGIYAKTGRGIVLNSGVIHGTSGAGIVLSQGGTIVDSGMISGSTVAVSLGGSTDNLVALRHGFALTGGIAGGATSSDTLSLLGTVGGELTVDYEGLRLTNFEDIAFGSGGHVTLKIARATGGVPLTISGFNATSDIIDLTGIGEDGVITATDTIGNHVTISGSLGTVSLQLDSSDSTNLTVFGDGGGGTNLAVTCFCRGTMILTEQSEVSVEALAVGDRVRTLSGALKSIVWIGMGRDLVTRANKLARPVIVRHGALADNVPTRDLYLTHGHALYLDGVLIPVENLVNHRSILWDERAQVVEYYHIELEDHDVLLANGAPAESYYDADNRARFHNTREGSAPGEAKPNFAPVLNGGDTVERVWDELFTRAGGQIEADVTSEPDLHLIVDGERIDPEVLGKGVYRFTVALPPSNNLLLRSRRGVPSLLGQNHSDHRPLGVAITQIALHQDGVSTYFDYDQPQLREGGCYPHEDGFCWTDGEVALPARFLPPLVTPFTLLVHTEPHPEMHYPLATGVARVAAA